MGRIHYTQWNRALLAHSLHFPLPNKGIDITLTGPANPQEVRLAPQLLIPG